METIEEEILEYLQQAKDKAGFLTLMVASQVVGSPALHESAVIGLTPHKLNITIEEARMVGLESIHAIMVSTKTLQQLQGRMGFGFGFQQLHGS